MIVPYWCDSSFFTRCSILSGTIFFNHKAGYVCVRPLGYFLCGTTGNPLHSIGISFHQKVHKPTSEMRGKGIGMLLRWVS